MGRPEAMLDSADEVLLPLEAVLAAVEAARARGSHAIVMADCIAPPSTRSPTASDMTVAESKSVPLRATT